MASKADLLAEAELLDLDVTSENSKAEIQAALDEANGVEPKAPTPAAPKAKKAITYRIKTPVEGFNGVSRGVAFADGVGETTNPWYATLCREAGYEVEEV